MHLPHLQLAAVLLLALLAFPSSSYSSSSFPYQDNPFLQLIPTRVTFANLSIAGWPSLPHVNPSTAYQVVASTLPSPNPSAYLVRPGHIDLLLVPSSSSSSSPSLLSLDSAGGFSVGDTARVVVIPPKDTFTQVEKLNTVAAADRVERGVLRVTSTSERVVVFSGDSVVQCAVSLTSSLTSLAASCAVTKTSELGSVFNASCTMTGDGCLIASSEGMFSFDTASAELTELHPGVASDVQIPTAVGLVGESMDAANTTAQFATEDHLFRRVGASSADWTTDWRHAISNGPINCITYAHDGTGIIASSDSFYVQDQSTSALWRYDGTNGVPYNETISCAAPVAPGPGLSDFVWLGTRLGAVRFTYTKKSVDDNGVPLPLFRYLYGPRWQPSQTVDVTKSDNAVVSVSTSVSGSSVWLLTPLGVSRIDNVWMTLAKKAAHFEEIAQLRHNRYGLMSDVGLREFGNVATYEQHSSDNDGLWTSLNVGALSFNYALTKSEKAWQEAWQSFEAMELLNNVTGIKGLMARSILKRGAPIPGGTWHNSSVFSEWQWKGDTSSDEVTGHMFVYPIVLDLLAKTPSQRQRVENLILHIASYLVDNDFYLIDVTGRPTTWGQWAPKQLNLNSSWYDERGVNSLQILAYLRSAYRISGDDKYSNATNYLLGEGYARNWINLKITVPDDDNYSDDELTFLPYYTWIYAMNNPFKGDRRGHHDAELDAQVQEFFDLSLNRTWAYVRRERPDLWNTIYLARWSGDHTSPTVAPELQSAVTDAVWYLQYWPWSLVGWPYHNSHRLDVHIDPYLTRGNSHQGEQLYPPDERQAERWNSNPYVLDGGSGFEECDPGAWILPYWMARWQGFIDG